ncbi:MAG: hypothetical protein GC187_10710 [Alphaproteobacteria bacterium]|nr:hypothetical protein [Alphaproteobacteria bacterium]
MRMFTVLSAIALALIPVGVCHAQQGDPMLQPYGMAPGSMTTHYTPPARDQQGNRVVVNGQIVDMSGRRAAPSSAAANFSGGVAAMGPSSLRQTSLNAVAIGNFVEISGARNSTFVINQRNYGRQTASASIGGSAPAAPQAGATAPQANGWPLLDTQAGQPGAPNSSLIDQYNSGAQSSLAHGR